MSGEQKLKDGDELTQTVESTNAAELLFFTSHCQVYKSRAADFADTKASVLGDYVASKLGMEEGEVPVYMAVTTDYAGHMLFFFQNGKCAKVPLSSYETKQNRKKLLKAYSDKAELACMLQLTDECELAVFTTAGRLLLAGSALIPEKTTRDTAGVNVVTLKKNQQIARVQRADGLELANPHRFRVRSLPAAGAILRAGGHGRADDAVTARRRQGRPAKNPAKNCRPAAQSLAIRGKVWYTVIRISPHQNVKESYP